MLYSKVMFQRFATILIFVFVITLPAFSQAQFKTVYVIQGSAPSLSVYSDADSIRWKISHDLNHWNLVPGQDSTVFSAIIDTIAFVRAEILHYDCPPYISDTAMIIPCSDINCPAQVSDFDGNIYSTVQIGGQCWMGQNLKTSHYADGTSIPLVESNTAWISMLDNDSTDAYCMYENDTANGSVYGYLYTWAAAMGGHATSTNSNPSQIQGACPNGWHLPSDSEWNQLGMQLGMSWIEANHTNTAGYNEGSQLAGDSALWTNGYLEQNSEFNLTGFMGLPAGSRFSWWGDFVFLSSDAAWWTTTENSDTHTTSRLIQSNSRELKRTINPKGTGISVRCLFDSVANEATPPIVLTLAPTSVSAYTIEASGHIVFNGLAQVSDYGFCFNKTGNPDLSDFSTNATYGSEYFYGGFGSLDANTSYYIKAYAQNSAGTTYGNQVMVHTSPGRPIVAIDSVFNPTQTTVDATGIVLNDGGTNLIDRGFCWSTNTNPTLSSSYLSLGTDTGAMSGTLTGLSGNTIYYIRAYAKNNYGTSYSDTVSILTGPDLPQIYISSNSSNSTHNSLLVSLQVGNNGGASILDMGVCWNQSGLPNTNDPTIHISPSTSLQDITINNLSPISSYYIRAFATNITGTGYSNTLHLYTTAGPPTISTNFISQISANTAYLQGEIISNGGATIIERGFCLNTSGGPTINDILVDAGSGNGIFSATASNLIPNTTYYARAYGKNYSATSYGNQISFTTAVGPPVVSSDSVLFDSLQAFSVHGSIVHTGGLPITEKGIIWSIEPEGNILSPHIANGSGNQPFSSSLSGLIPGTAYFVRAYAQNSMGIGYGETIKMVNPGIPCPGAPTLIDIDGNVYATIQMGNQCWMRENLKVERYPNGDSIPHITSDTEWANLPDNDTSDAFCFYDNSTNNLATFGGLYTWAAAMGGHAISTNSNPSNTQGACPDGWHLPSDQEWMQLDLALGMDETELSSWGSNGEDIGSMMAENSSEWPTYCDLRNSAFFDTTNFDGLPSGKRYHSNGAFGAKGSIGFFWSTSICGYDSARITSRELWWLYDGIGRNGIYKSAGASIRCLKDGGIVSSSPTLIIDSISNTTESQSTVYCSIVNAAGSLITSRGVCINQQGQPGVQDQHKTSGQGMGSFIIDFENLSSNTTYYIRAFANNAAGIGYSPEVSFTTLSGNANIVLLPAKNISNTSATVDCKIINNGGSATTASGICYNTLGNPTLSDSIVYNTSGQATFTLSLDSLKPATIYYCRAFATNASNTSFSNEIHFSHRSPECPGEPKIRDIDGNVYDAVHFGNQCWMDQNLRTSHYPSGQAIPYIDNKNDWEALDINITEDAFCWPVFDSTNAKTYGAFYSWAAAMGDSAVSSNSNPSGVQGVCPDGWHLPSDSEWQELELFLGMPQTELSNLSWRGTQTAPKFAGDSTLWYNNLLELSSQFDASGFRALPAGYQSYLSIYPSFHRYSYFWTATEYVNYAPSAYNRVFEYNKLGLFRGAIRVDVGLSVRCTKDIVPDINDLPEVNTLNATNISLTGCQAHANIVSSGSTTISSSGFCWNTTGKPTTLDSVISSNTSSGSFSLNISNLLPDRNYFVRAYATNSQGTSYGDVIKISTLNSLSSACPMYVYDYEGTQYPTAEIGNQCWMAENLRTKHYENGAEISLVSSNQIWANPYFASYSIYDLSIFNETEYGYLYNWETIMGMDDFFNDTSSILQGICPTGWHLPDSTETTILINELGGSNTAGQQLKESGYSHWNTHANGGNNNSGFSALPGGLRHPYNAHYLNMTMSGHFWIMDESNFENGLNLQILFDSHKATISPINKRAGLSVRCIKD